MAKPLQTPNAMTPTDDTAETALESTLALASVGIAAVRTMETVLPTAAGDVERASRDLADRFQTLAENAAAMDKLVHHLLEMLVTAGADVTVRHNAEHEAMGISKNIHESIRGIIMDMQFQDRNTQMMESAAHILKRYGAMLEEIRDKILAVRDGDMVFGNDISHAVEHILSGIRIGEIRTQFVESLSKAKVLYRDTEVAAHKPAPSDDVELF